MKLTDIDSLNELTVGKVIKGYNVTIRRSFGAKFASAKGYIQIDVKQKEEWANTNCKKNAKY